MPEATQVSIEPYSEDDWEVLELNAELAEAATLNQVPYMHPYLLNFPFSSHIQDGCKTALI